MLCNCVCSLWRVFKERSIVHIVKVVGLGKSKDIIICLGMMEGERGMRPLFIGTG